MPKAKVAAGFVIFKRISNLNLQYLLLQASNEEHHWTPPKGHMDPGEEDAMITAYRETVEESGLNKSDLKVFTDTKRVLQYDVRGKPKTVTYWLAELVNPNANVIISDEHQDYKWLSFEDACKYAKYNDMQSLLKDYDQFLKDIK